MGSEVRATGAGLRCFVVLAASLGVVTVLLAAPPERKSVVLQNVDVDVRDIPLEKSVSLEHTRKKATGRRSPRQMKRIILKGDRNAPEKEPSGSTIETFGRRVIILGGDDTLKPAHAAQESAESPLRGWKLLHDTTYDPATEDIYDALAVGQVRGIMQYTYDPESAETGVINVDEVIRRAMQKYPDGLDGYVLLDFEHPFFSILHAGPSDPRFAEVRDNYVELIRRFKENFPNAVVTHYNIPYIPFWVRNSDDRSVWWPQIDDETRASFEVKLDALQPILDELDWFCPRYYDFIPSARLSDEVRDRQVRAEIEYRKQFVEWIKDYVAESDRQDREIIPVGRTRWTGGVEAHDDLANMLIPKDEFIDEQLVPAMQGGAHGLMLFEVYETWMLNIAFTDPERVTDERREESHELLRRIGLLEEGEVPEWWSAAEKRRLLHEIGMQQASYLAAMAARMRAEPRAETVNAP